ncbi:UNVERIFIED_CONTAM: CAAX prenyl protease-like protein [Acetivibrio alkalicellulosi]
MQSINMLLSAIVQIVLFSLIPFIWWLFTVRKHTGFLKWIGFKKPIIENKGKYIASCLVIIVFFIILFLIVPFLVENSNLATAQFTGQGAKALIPALIYAFLQTGLSEEIFFRGFLTKRLTGKFGFKVGNTVQGMLFGLLHGIMFLSLVGPFRSIIIIIFTGVLGSLMGWINEKQSGGSIVSSWLLHGGANICVSIVAMFSVL